MDIRLKEKIYMGILVCEASTETDLWYYQIFECNSITVDNGVIKSYNKVHGSKKRSFDVDWYLCVLICLTQNRDEALELCRREVRKRNEHV